jgi:hypothetical protein
MEDVFVGSEALTAGVLTRGQLRWNYRSIFPGVYIGKEASPSLLHRVYGAWLWSGRRAIVAGLSASALHCGRCGDEAEPVELIWRCGRPPWGIVVRNERIEPDEIMEVAGLPATTPERTALDLAKHDVRDAAVVNLDALARATDLSADAVLPLLDGGSTSPKATLLRLALMDAGFPAARTRIPVTDGKTDAFVELGYEAPMVGVAFGGEAPELPGRLGWTMIRADMRTLPAVVYQVRAAVIQRGFPLYKLRRAAAN